MKKKRNIAVLVVLITLLVIFGGIGVYAFFTDYQIADLQSQSGVSLELIAEEGVSNAKQEGYVTKKLGTDVAWYRSGDTAKISAELDEGYTFKGWYNADDDLVSDVLTFDYTVTSYTVLTARTEETASLILTVDELPDVTSKKTLTVTGTVSDNIHGVKSVVVNDTTEAVLSDAADADGVYTWKATVSISGGENIITVVATNNDGRTRKVVDTVTHDAAAATIGPEVTFIAPVSENANKPTLTGSMNTTYTVSAHVFDVDDGIAAVTLKVGDSEAVAAAVDSETNLLTAEIVLSPGSVTAVEIAATDGVGNTTTETCYVQVAWDVSEAQDGSIAAYVSEDSANAGKYALTIAGTGVMKNWMYNETVDFHAGAYKTNITSVSIGEGVTTVGSNAFRGFSGLSGSVVTSDSASTIDDGTSAAGAVMLPDSIVSIGSAAFADCSGLSGVLTLPRSLTTIGSMAFQFCRGLNDRLVIPDTVTSIGSQAFWSCSGLTGTLTIPNTVSVIGNSAFKDCSGLTGLNLGTGVRLIDDYAFFGCSGLTGSLVIPGSVKSIGANAFSYCFGLNGSLTIGSGVQTIGYAAFRDCTGLRGTLTIGSGVKTIDDFAFYGCSGLTESLMIPGSVTSIGYYAFTCCSGLTEVSFVDQTGWYVTQIEDSLSGTIVDLSIPTENATMLTNTYYNYYWCKNPAVTAALSELFATSVPNGVIVGAQQAISTMPDVYAMNAAAAAASSNTTLYGWLVDSGLSRQILLPEELGPALLAIYTEEPNWIITLMPLYQTFQPVADPVDPTVIPAASAGDAAGETATADDPAAPTEDIPAEDAATTDPQDDTADTTE